MISPAWEFGRALIEGEVRRGALGDRVGVAEDALGGVEDHVLGGLGVARAVEGEGGPRSGWPPAWVVEVVVVKESIGSAGQGGGGARPPGRAATAATTSASDHALSSQVAHFAASALAGRGSSVALALVVVLACDALAVLLDDAVLACASAVRRCRRCRRRCRCLGGGGAWRAGPWHSSEACAGRRRRDDGEAAAGAGVVDLHAVPFWSCGTRVSRVKK